MPAPSSLSSRQRWILYGILVALLFGVALLAKAAVVVLAYRVLYSLPWVGGMVRSLELVELINILIFAVVGMGLGLLSRLNSTALGDRVNTIILAIGLPVLFLSGGLFHYQLWVNGVSTAQELTYGAARSLTDRWLTESVGGGGFWGYYRFTAQYTLLPMDTEEVQVAVLGVQRVGNLLGSVLDRSGETVTGLLSLNTWLLRLFYFGIACLSGLTHFQDGRAHVYKAQLRQAQAREQAAARSAAAQAARSKARDPQRSGSADSAQDSGAVTQPPSQAELDRLRRERDRQARQRQIELDRERDQQRRQVPQARSQPQIAPQSLPQAPKPPSPQSASQSLSQTPPRSSPQPAQNPVSQPTQSPSPQPPQTSSPQPAPPPSPKSSPQSSPQNTPQAPPPAAPQSPPNPQQRPQ